MAQLLAAYAAAAAARWRRALALALMVIAGIAVLAVTAGGAFVDKFSAPGTESQRALDLLQERFPARAGDEATLVFFTEDGSLRTPERRRAVAEVVADVEGQPNVTTVSDPLASPRSGQVSRDGTVAFTRVQYDEPAQDLGAAADERLADAAALARGSGVRVARNGQVVDVAEQRPAPVGELIGIAVAIVVLTLVFRSVAAMALTLVSALLSIAVGMLLLTIGARWVDFPSFAPTLAVMLGLGAGIDYALLIVGRYREQLAAGDTVPHSARVANATAGTSVIAAGVIVVVAISGLLVTGVPFLGRMGIASAIVVATVAVGAVTLLPIFMGAFARRLQPKDARTLGPSEGSARWDQKVTGHPWLAATAGILALVILAAPFASLRLGQPDDGNDPADSTTRIAYDTLAAGFGPGFNGPLVLAVALSEDGDAAELARLRRAVDADPGVAAVGAPEVNAAGDAATIGVIPTTSPQDEATSDLVTRLRDDVIPPAVAGTQARVYVGGSTATLGDLAEKIASRLPLFIVVVVGLSILLLMLVFRSVLVPVVSAAFNLLSILAAYGVIVAVFQFGWGSSLLGVDGEVPIVSFVPLFMFAVLFGLSMDYNVFLLSRVREEFLAGASAKESVIRGLSRVARIILGAGVIMTAVFLGFVTDQDVIVKMIGLGLAVSILIDVTIVRMVVAPAVMTLLGDRAWWLPGWLDRILPTVALEG
jgi:RND superfamily putative drug exporter